MADDWQVVEEALLVSAKRDPAFLALARLREREAQLERLLADWLEASKQIPAREELLIESEARVAELEEALREIAEIETFGPMDAPVQIARAALAHKEEPPTERSSAPHPEGATPPYQIALRTDSRGLDDVVVKDVAMFRMERMSDDHVWFACYLADGQDIHFNLWREKKAVRYAAREPLPDVVYEVVAHKEETP